jgi:hypothetical protein
VFDATVESGDLAGSVPTVLARNVRHVDQAAASFAAMMTGWELQQRQRSPTRVPFVLGHNQRVPVAMAAGGGRGVRGESALRRGRSRFLKASTIGARRDMVRRFGNFNTRPR